MTSCDLAGRKHRLVEQMDEEIMHIGIYEGSMIATV